MVAARPHLQWPVAGWSSSSSHFFPLPRSRRQRPRAELSGRRRGGAARPPSLLFSPLPRFRSRRWGGAACPPGLLSSLLAFCRLLRSRRMRPWSEFSGSRPASGCGTELPDHVTGMACTRDYNVS